MSQNVPSFFCGATVRIMQTDEMVERGLANQHGVVVSVWQEIEDGVVGQVCRVQLQDKFVTVHAHSLQHAP